MPLQELFEKDNKPGKIFCTEYPVNINIDPAGIVNVQYMQQKGTGDYFCNQDSGFGSDHFEFMISAKKKKKLFMYSLAFINVYKWYIGNIVKLECVICLK